MNRHYIHNIVLLLLLGATTPALAQTIKGKIYGGGQGEEGSEKAKVTGNADVIVDKNWEPTPEP